MHWSCRTTDRAGTATVAFAGHADRVGPVVQEHPDEVVIHAPAAYETEFGCCRGLIRHLLIL